MDDKLVKTQQAADILCVSKAWLERDRWAGPTIPFVKVGRSVRYWIGDLQNYLDDRRIDRSDFEN